MDEKKRRSWGPVIADAILGAGAGFTLVLVIYSLTCWAFFCLYDPEPYLLSGFVVGALIGGLIGLFTSNQRR